MLKRSPLSKKPARRPMAALVEELNPPAPFTLDGFRTWLEERYDRRVLLIATPMPPGGPSGVWLRTDSADYFHYEERTSPFHQAHIVATLAAHLLLAGSEGGGASRYLISALDLQARQPFHGIDIGDSISRSETEALAFEILRRTGSFPGALQSHMLLWRLKPLQSALLAVAPSAAADLGRATPIGVTSRLYRTVIDIRDAALTLVPHSAAGPSTISGRQAPEQGIPLPSVTTNYSSLPAGRVNALSCRLRGIRSAEPRESNLPADLRAEVLTLIQQLNF